MSVFLVVRDIALWMEKDPLLIERVLLYWEEDPFCCLLFETFVHDQRGLNCKTSRASSQDTHAQRPVNGQQVLRGSTRIPVGEGLPVPGMPGVRVVQLKDLEELREGVWYPLPLRPDRDRPDLYVRHKGSTFNAAMAVLKAHQLVPENARSVPIIYKDGNRGNLSPSNLIVSTRGAKQPVPITVQCAQDTPVPVVVDQVLAYLQQAKAPVHYKVIAEAIGRPHSSVSPVLSALCNLGQVERVGNGTWAQTRGLLASGQIAP